MPQHELKAYSYPHNLQNRVNHINQFPGRPILAESTSETTFVQGVFGEIDPEELLVKEVGRPQEGIGPHFDLHDDLVNPEHPFIATYNIHGEATLRATALPKELWDYYKSQYPEATEQAKIARRHLGALALMDPTSTVYKGTVRKGTGLIIPQVVGEPPLIHNIAPLSRHRSVPNPARGVAGKFLKFVAPRPTMKALRTLEKEGYGTFAERQLTQARKEEERIKVLQEVERINKLNEQLNKVDDSEMWTVSPWEEYDDGPRFGGGVLD